MILELVNFAESKLFASLYALETGQVHNLQHSLEQSPIPIVDLVREFRHYKVDFTISGIGGFETLNRWR